VGCICILQYILHVQKEHLTAVHTSQLNAYREAAVAALESWARTVRLPEINRTLHDSLSAYQKSCRAVTAATRPLWRESTSSSSSSSSSSNSNPTSVMESALSVIDARAAELYAQNSTAAAATSKQIEPSVLENFDNEEGEVEEGVVRDDNATMETLEEGEEDEDAEEGEEIEAVEVSPALQAEAANKASATSSSTTGTPNKQQRGNQAIKKKIVTKTKIATTGKPLPGQKKPGGSLSGSTTPPLAASSGNSTGTTTANTNRVSRRGGRGGGSARGGGRGGGGGAAK
jgi:hypothetical protein